jgi:ribose transport system substrate-binding protein
MEGNMTRTKRYLTVVLAVLMIFFTAAACNRGSKDDSGTIKIKIGWAPPDITGVFKTATDYMELAIADAKKHGIEIELITRSAASHADNAGQVSAIENFIQNEVNCIVVSPADVETIKQVLAQANELNIPIIMVNLLDEQEGIKVSNFVGFDNAQAAAVSGYSMLDALGGPGVLGKGEKADIPVNTEMNLAWWTNFYKDVPRDSISGKIAIIGGIAGNWYTNERNRGFGEVVGQFPGVQIMTTLSADWERQPAVAAAENIIQNFPDIDGIYASCAEMALGTAIAVKNAGLEDRIIVISNDGTPESVQAIRDGAITAETWHGFPEWGWYAMQFAVMLTLGEDVPLKYDIRPRTEYVGNADNFYPTPKVDPIDWEGIKAARKK